MDTALIRLRGAGSELGNGFAGKEAPFRVSSWTGMDVNALPWLK